jgi:16S rRNA (guanine527-N7)-methyltransferase
MIHHNSDAFRKALQAALTVSRIDFAWLPANRLERMLDQFEHYFALLLDWNQRINLTAITDLQGVVVRHFVDSLTLLAVLPAPQPADIVTKVSLIDVGTGAGFPGLALAIARPDIDITVMDSTAKKVKFCSEVIRQLNLDCAQALHARAEEQAHLPGFREQFDLATARAVAALPTLLEYVLPFVRVGGQCIAMKGSDADAEVAQAQTALQKLGGKLHHIHPVQLPGLSDQRALIVMNKVAPTPTLYPRQGGAPRSNPLI